MVSITYELIFTNYILLVIFFFLFFFFNHFAYQSLPKNYRGHSSGSLSSSLIATESYQSLAGVGKY